MADFHQHRRRYCPECQRYVLALRDPMDMTLHALACVITCCLWLIPFVFICIYHEYDWRCQTCGSRCHTRAPLFGGRKKARPRIEEEDEEPEPPPRPRKKRRRSDDDDDRPRKAPKLPPRDDRPRGPSGW